MDYNNLVDSLDDLLEKTKEISVNTLEFSIGFTKSFLTVGSSHLVAPTIVRKLIKSYEDDEIHRYLPIDKKDKGSRGIMLGTALGVASWTAQYGLLLYFASEENSNLHLIPLATNTLSLAYEAGGFFKNRKTSKKAKNIEQKSSE